MTRLLIFTIVLIECAVLPNALDSGILRLPLYVLGTTLLTCVAIARGNFRRENLLHFTPLHAVAGLSILLLLSTAILHYDPVYSPDALAFALGSILVFVVASTMFQEDQRVWQLIGGLEWLSIILCLVAATQLWFARILPFEFYLGPERRVPSLLGNSAFFSAYLIIVIPLVLARVMTESRFSLGATYHYALLAFMTVMLFATRTRSSLAGGVVGLLVMVLTGAQSGRQRKLIGLIVILILAAGGIMNFPAGGNDGRATLDRRLVFWEAGLKGFASAPLAGHGPGSFERILFEYRSPEYWKSGSEDLSPHAHNAIIETSVEFGILGLVLAGVAVIAILLRIRTELRTITPDRRWMFAGIIGALAGVAVDNLANVSLYQPQIAILACTLAGILFRQSRGFKRDAGIGRAWSAGIFLTWAIGALLFACQWEGQVSAEVSLHRALIAEARGSDEALHYLREAVEKNPWELLARSFLVRDLLAARHWEEALREDSLLQQRSPLYPKSSLMRAYALLSLGRLAEARTSIERELALRSHPEALRVRESIIESERRNPGAASP